MAAIRVLVDTDVLIDHLNAGDHSVLLEDPRNRIYYSIVTRKELLAKRGLSTSQRQAIDSALQRFRLVPLGRAVVDRYSVLRRNYTSPREGGCPDRGNGPRQATALGDGELAALPADRRPRPVRWPVRPPTA